jgi:uncharacterized membrane protein YcgQ (UPF0703/DUF1980 family)
MKPVTLNVCIACVVCAVTGVFGVLEVARTKRKLEAFNTALGKTETVTLTQAVRTFLNDNKMGTFDENVRFINAGFTSGVIEIKEKMFIAQTNDIYLNVDEYLGKTIKLEGLFKIEDFAWQERPFYYVVRYGPGCCGYDGSAGFEVLWEAAAEPKYAREDDWVLAQGTLTAHAGGGGIYIALDRLTVLNKRGAEFVRQ